LKIEEHIRQLTEGTAKVKLPGGIVGKASYVLIAFCVALASIAVAIRSPGIGYAAIGTLAVIVPAIIWRLIRFAERHPAPAILEGAEYIAYQQIQLAQKNVGELPPLARRTTLCRTFTRPSSATRAIPVCDRSGWNDMGVLAKEELGCCHRRYRRCGAPDCFATWTSRYKGLRRGRGLVWTEANDSKGAAVSGPNHAMQPTAVRSDE